MAAVQAVTEQQVTQGRAERDEAIAQREETKLAALAAREVASARRAKLEHELAAQQAELRVCGAGSLFIQNH